jgi:hypothetical protein
MTKTGEEWFKEMSNKIECNEFSKSLSNEEINNIALHIVKDIKKIVETILIKDIGDAYKELSNEFKMYKTNCTEKPFYLELFDNSQNFYQVLQKYSNSQIAFLLDSEYNLDDIKLDFKNSFAINGFSVLTDLLIKILEKEKNAFHDKTIKSDISILVDIIAFKVSRISKTSSMFLCSINELEMKYGKFTLNSTEFIDKMNTKFKLEAKDKFDSIKKQMYKYILSVSSKIKCRFDEDLKRQYNLGKLTGDYSGLEKLGDESSIFSKFYLEITNNRELYENNVDQLALKCKEPAVYSFFNNYALSLISSSNEIYVGSTKEYILENILLPFKINDIDINNLENIKIIYNIPPDYRLVPKHNYKNTFLGHYLEMKEELDYVKQRNYAKEIDEILSNDNFIGKFFSILSSNSVSSYLNSKIKFLEKNQVKIVKEDEPFDIFLGPQYELFLKDFQNDYKKFRNLIIIKQICYKIPAMTNSSMRIFINPIYEISKNVQEDESQLRAILEAAIIVLLIHEITHFLKAYPINNTYPETFPNTPRKNENGRCIMLHLFNVDVIQTINYKQALLINQVGTWKDIEELRKIFEKNDNNYGKSEGELDFYLATKDEDETYYERNEYCFWY